ncbi:Short-chain dehydrogenase/reductase family protein [Mycena kentingensis (nom. inval.)]|nr:Short-chain dehydrogenase/reductase family protein [Mycena kentingensis (nom. inval.)]
MSLPAFTSHCTAEDAAKALKAEIVGKNVLITGTSLNGIGFEAARVVAQYANLVIITGYNAARLRISEEEINKEFPNANIRTLILDLASLASIRKAAAEVNAYIELLHVIVHNAATMCTYRLTEDDIELQSATAHFGPFLFTKLIAPKLVSARDGAESLTPRVVYVASEAHLFGTDKIEWSNLRRGAPPEEATTGNNLHGIIQALRRDEGLHPGMVKSNAFDNLKGTFKNIFKDAAYETEDGQIDFNVNWKTMAQSVATYGFYSWISHRLTELLSTIVAAFDPRLNDKAGTYLVDCVPAPQSVAAYAADPNNGKKLWDMTEEILGEKFAF